MVVEKAATPLDQFAIERFHARDPADNQHPFAAQIKGRAAGIAAVHGRHLADHRPAFLPEIPFPFVLPGDLVGKPTVPDRLHGQFFHAFANLR